MTRILLLLATLFPATNGAEKPNILFIFADDLGWNPLSPPSAPVPGRLQGPPVESVRRFKENPLPSRLTTG